VSTAIHRCMAMQATNVAVINPAFLGAFLVALWQR
jgi:uncharacterized membrane protein